MLQLADFLPAAATGLWGNIDFLIDGGVFDSSTGKPPGTHSLLPVVDLYPDELITGLTVDLHFNMGGGVNA